MLSELVKFPLAELVTSPKAALAAPSFTVEVVIVGNDELDLWREWRVGLSPGIEGGMFSSP